MNDQITVTIQPGMVSSSPRKRNTNPWSSDIFDCCQDMGICCLGFWCLPCLMCRTSYEFGECLCLPLLDGGFIHPVSLSLRSSIRERYNIQGTLCNDCCVTTYFNWCVWCQMARELKKHREPLIVAHSTQLSVAPYPSYPSLHTPARL
ncbi:hypothetical protein SKAU_G00367530 [Synaphobranchus kaupii]|uniref:Cornifelin n=1 Tax=Synaphobranchus kaupii TaxID=118154 RepID=A0A9Q1IFG8_SYNKA|nr:hypothetical protein SKAU_G00367530 [Synaphobranchus kaupii]